MGLHVPEDLGAISLDDLRFAQEGRERRGGGRVVGDEDEPLDLPVEAVNEEDGAVEPLLDLPQERGVVAELRSL